MGNSLNSILFQPPRPSTYTKREMGADLRFVRSGKDNLAVLVRASGTPDQERVLILYSHGNAQDLGGIDSMIAELSNELISVGISSVIAAYDYSGYGLSSGRPSEATTYRNAEDVLKVLMDEFSIPHHRVVVWGRSLGSGPTCFIAHKAMHHHQKPFGAVILQSPLLSAFRVGLNSTSYYRWPMDQFCNYERIRSGFGRDTRIFVIHGMLDDVVPFTHGKTMFESIPERNRYPPLFVAGAGHNDVEWRLCKYGAGNPSTSSASKSQASPKDLNKHVAEFVQHVFNK